MARNKKQIIPRKVQVDSLPVELCKLLKFDNVVGSGGEAKYVIAEGLVSVNGEVETRKRRKINSGDLVGFNGEIMEVTE